MKVKKEETVRPRSDPFGADGGVAVLYGNLVPRRHDQDLLGAAREASEGASIT